MTNFTSIKLTVMDSIPTAKKQYEYNGTGPLNGTSPSSNDSSRKFVQIFIFLICSLGILGNSLVIWLLSFCIKKNPFTTYVLNLSIADLGFLIIDWIGFNPVSPTYGKGLVFIIIHFMYSASQYFLTAISVDRCVSVFFPLWYRCHRPKHLSTIVCTLIWVISFLPPGIAYMVYKDKKNTSYSIVGYQVILNCFLCFPLMAISSLMLVSKICSKLEGRKQRKVLMMVLVTVLCFLIFYFPVNAVYICDHLFHTQINILPFSDDICACLNSSVNPIIYGLIGRDKNGCSMKSLKEILQGLFSDEELSVQMKEKDKTLLK